MRGLAVDDSHVYFAVPDDGKVERVSLETGTRETVAAGQSLPTEMVIDERNVYWVNAGDSSIMAAPLGGGTPVLLARSDGQPSTLVVDATYVYWAMNGIPDSGGSGIAKAPLAGGPVVVLASQERSTIWDMALSSGNLYWTAGQFEGVKRLPIDGGVPTTIVADDSNPRGIAVDSSSVYWFSSTQVKRASLPEGTSQVLATVGNAQAIALDGSYLYYAPYQIGALARVPIGGGSPVMVAGNVPIVYRMVVRGANVYWSDGLNGIWTVAK